MFAVVGEFFDYWGDECPGVPSSPILPNACAVRPFPTLMLERMSDFHATSSGTTSSEKSELIAPSSRPFTDLLVTGGAGFIGSNFVHRTLTTRPDVRILMMDSMTYAANPANLSTTGGVPLGEAFPGRFSFAQVDIADAPKLHSLISEWVGVLSAPESRAAIVHFAAESHNDNSLLNPGIFARTNVEGTVNLCEAAVQHGIHLHHISTDEVFGDLALDDPARFSVDTPYAPSSPYSASKASADHFVRAFVRSRGLSATISNCSNNYGPRQHPEKFIPRQITGLIEREKPRLYGTGDNVRDWIHVDDHNDAVWAILDAVVREKSPVESGQTFLIGANGERSNIQVVRDLLEVFDRDADDFVHVTDRPGHDRRYAIDPSSIEALGWRPKYTDFRAGLVDTVSWYQANEQWWRETRAASEKKYRLSEKEL